MLATARYSYHCSFHTRDRDGAVIRITYYGPSQNVQLHANPEGIIWAKLQIIVYM